MKNYAKALTIRCCKCIILALMSDSLPKSINPWLLFRHNETLDGTIALAEMPNLLASQLRKEGLVNAKFAVEKRVDGRIVLQGEADVILKMLCQRCMKNFERSFSTSFELVLVKYEGQVESVSEDDDAVVCEDSLVIAPLFEQELILSLPMIAKHDDCEAEYENSEEQKDEIHNPFANLKDLLN